MSHGDTNVSHRTRYNIGHYEMQHIGHFLGLRILYGSHRLIHMSEHDWVWSQS